MHVALDCRYAFPHLSGIGRYVTQLVRGLAVHPERPARISVICRDPEALTRLLGPLPGIDPVRLDIAPRSPGGLLPLRSLLKRLGPDVFHTPDAFAPLFPTCATVITIHDLIPLACRGRLSRGLKSRFAPVWKAWQRTQCRHASAVLTCSQHSLSDVRDILRPDMSRVSVVYPGLPPATPGTDPEVLTRLGVSPGRYLLYVGRRDPYKNVAACVRVLGRLRDSHPDLKLVLAGHPDPRFPEPEIERDRLGLADRVVTAGHLSDAEIEALYASAGVTVLLSRYEGFGYTILESMARGTPVVSSPRTSLREVGGDVPMYADPDDTDAAADAAHRLLTDATLRAEHVRRGYANVARFTLERQASETLEVYRRVLRR